IFRVTARLVSPDLDAHGRRSYHGPASDGSATSGLAAEQQIHGGDAHSIEPGPRPLGNELQGVVTVHELLRIDVDDLVQKARAVSGAAEVRREIRERIRLHVRNEAVVE